MNTEDNPMDGTSVLVEGEDQLETQLKAIEDQLVIAATSSDEIEAFFQSTISVLSELPKAKAAKVVRAWVDRIASLENDNGINIDAQMKLCECVIEWTIQEKRTFLKHRVQVKLAWIMYQQRHLTKGMAMIDNLAYEIKRLEEKVLLVEVHLIQSKMFYEVKNVARAKAALTACRANANSVHISTQLQAEIEFTGGILAAAEHEYHVAHSYFQEAFDGYTTIREGNEARVSQSATMMLLMRLMEHKLDEFFSMVKSKTYIPLHTSHDVAAVISLGSSVKDKDLQQFKELRRTTEYLNTDVVVKGHLSDLEDRLLGEVIVRMLNAYSRCGIAHVAKTLKLDTETVNRQLTNLILDGKLHASVSEDEDVITIDEPAEEPVAMRDALETIKNLSEACNVIETIAQRSVVK